MNFQNFLSNIISSFNNTFSNITNLISPIFENNFIKLITYFLLFDFIIYLLFEIIKTINNIFSQKKSVSKEKTTNKSTDIE